MIDERERYERAFQHFQMTEPAWEILVDRRDRKRRNRRITAGVVGIVVFVAAVWIVTSGLSFDRSTPAVPGLETGPTQTAPPPAPASAAPDVVTPDVVTNEEMCSDGARSRLELTDLGDRIEVRFEVHQSPVGHEWRIVLRRVRGIPNDSRDTVVFFRGTRVAAEDGEVVVQRRVWDTIRFDWVLAKAVDTQTGQVCKVDATIG
jgi:hypothetical protein